MYDIVYFCAVDLDIQTFQYLFLASNFSRQADAISF